MSTAAYHQTEPDVAPLPPTEPSREHPADAREHSPDSQPCSIDEHDSPQTSNSIALGASSPLTASEGDSDRATTTKAGTTGAGSRTSRAPSPTHIPKDLCDILCALHQLRCGRHPALSTHCDRLEFPLSISGYHRFQQLLFDPDPRPADVDVTHDLDLDTGIDLKALRSWAQRKLRWDYDAQQAVLGVRMISVFHQAVNQELGTLLRDRFHGALTASGREGEIRYRAGVQHIFREPERPRPQPTPRSTPPRELRLKHFPHRVRRRDEAERLREPAAAENHEGTRASASSGTAETRDEEESPDETVEDTYTPDTGLYYVPPGSKPDYFPGLFLEVGWSHQLPDSRAKRMIRHGGAIVRYVMAFNVEHDTTRQKRGITITAHELRSNETKCFPGKCLDNYNVRENAGRDDIDIGLRLSHLHEQLLPAEGEEDISVKLPLQRLVQIVDDAFAEQEVHDKYERGSQSRLPWPRVMQGKRFSSATPSEDGDEEEALLRRPDASYAGPSSKRRRMNKAET